MVSRGAGIGADSDPTKTESTLLTNSPEFATNRGRKENLPQAGRIDLALTAETREGG